jgi:hypothetical protein
MEENSNLEFFDGISKLKNRDWGELQTKPEDKRIAEEKQRNALASYLWKEETKSLRIHKNAYTGDMDAYHEGYCCSGCMSEREDGYSGGGNYCCCYEGLTPLEQWGNPVKYPPVDGKIPQEFQYFGHRTAKRWIERYKNELLPEELEDYYK